MEISEEVVEPVEVEETALDESELTEEEYTPDFTYKVKDETREFDERVRGAVTNKEAEDYFRDLYTKADGLDGYKSKVSEVETKYGSTKQERDLLHQAVERLQSYRDKGDMRSLMQSLGVNDEAITEYALSLVEEEQLPEDQKNLIRQNRELEQRLNSLESSAQQRDSLLQEQSTQQDLDELKGLMTSVHLPVVEAMHEKGLSFADTVVQQGLYDTQVSGREPTVSEVAEKVAKQFSYLVAQPEQPTTTPGEKPVLPKVRGAAGTTPIDKPIMTLAELKSIRDARD